MGSAPAPLPPPPQGHRGSGQPRGAAAAPTWAGERSGAAGSAGPALSPHRRQRPGTRAAHGASSCAGAAALRREAAAPSHLAGKPRGGRAAPLSPHPARCRSRAEPPPAGLGLPSAGRGCAAPRSAPQGSRRAPQVRGCSAQVSEALGRLASVRHRTFDTSTFLWLLFFLNARRFSDRILQKSQGESLARILRDGECRPGTQHLRIYKKWN